MRVRYEIRARDGVRLPRSHEIFLQQSLEFVKKKEPERYGVRIADLEGWLVSCSVVPAVHVEMCEVAMRLYRMELLYAGLKDSAQWFDELDLQERIMRYVRD